MTNKEAIERIERNICSHMDWCRYRDCERCEVELAIEALEKQATSEWIPVSDRTPVDPGESVLITVNGTYKNITFEDAIMMAVYDKDEGWIIDGYEYWRTAQVTAWQPLPEPYKGE